MNNILIPICILLILIFIIFKYQENFSCGNLEFVYYENGKKLNLEYDDLLKKKFDIFIIAGVHGNEYAPPYGLDRFIKDNHTKFKGSILFIPRVNEPGLNKKVRYMSCFGEKYDINRNFKSNGNLFQQKIMNLAKRSALTIDFHEGYDYNIINKNSIGSTIMNSSNKNLGELVSFLVHKVNLTIPDKNKKFVYLNNYKYIKNSFRHYCIQNGLDYILVEITGQNNAQKLDVRIKQTLLLLENIFKYKDLIKKD